MGWDFDEILEKLENEPTPGKEETFDKLIDTVIQFTKTITIMEEQELDDLTISKMSVDVFTRLAFQLTSNFEQIKDSDRFVERVSKIKSVGFEQVHEVNKDLAYWLVLYVKHFAPEYYKDLKVLISYATASSILTVLSSLHLQIKFAPDFIEFIKCQDKGQALLICSYNGIHHLVIPHFKNAACRLALIMTAPQIYIVGMYYHASDEKQEVNVNVPLSLDELKNMPFQNN
ncbi:MAG: hypothetical protein KatS3mg087_2087 [Patescibacteria group bacterium]|nr:MAG: hypothetical protein KatS3mg087_2087 [Patescibacteria group bacterium]